MVRFLLLLVIALFAHAQEKIKLYHSHYKVIHTDRSILQIRIGDKSILKVKTLDSHTLMLFGKNLGKTSLALIHKDKSLQLYVVHVAKDITPLQNIIYSIDPNIALEVDSDNHLLITGRYSSVASRHLVEKILNRYDFNSSQIIDLAKRENYDRLVRARLYAIEINENRAKDLRSNLSLIHDSSVKSFLQTLPTSPTFAGSLLSAGYKRLSGGINIDLLVKYLQSQGVAKVINDTMITMKEEHNGTIFVGGEIYIPSQISYDANGRPTIGTISKEYGLKLTVTPKILDNDVIEMQINLTSSDFDTNPDHKIAIGSDLQGNPIFIPGFISKESTTSLLAKNNQVIAIGGKLSNISIQSLQKVPILGDIPLLGNLFKNRSQQKRESEIIFFIVPTIETIDTLQNDKKSFKKYNVTKGNIFSISRKQTIPIEQKPKSIETIGPQATLSKEQNLTKKQNIQLYKVKVRRCFIRNRDRKIVDIWKKNHPFFAQKSDLEGFLAIKKDCDYTHNCFKRSNELYISYKCVKKD